MNSIVRVLLPFVLIILGISCSKKTLEEQQIAFSMSDTMMHRCEFSKARFLEVKNVLRLFGKIAADNNKQAEVYPIVGGSVLKINVELGDYVEQGQVLATVRSSEIADFERQRLDARADAALAEKNLQVAYELFDGKLNSERDVKAAKKELEKAQAELNRINEVFAIYNIKQGSVYNITAPISGFIVSKNISPNEQFRNDKADVIFSIARIDEVWALANVNESDISLIQPGYEADISTISYPDTLFHGKVDRIFNAIDPSTKAMKVLVKIANPNYLLKPEMSTTVNVSYSENKKLIAVPSSSIIFDKSRNWVMVFKDRNNIETRQIEVYRQLEDITWVSSGIIEGETVISKNGLMIYDALND
jgi:cobalt-zinc-cadmium efflux system membrane fusion protein